MKVASLAVGAFQANAWLAWDPDTGKGILIDPGDEARRLADWVERTGVEVEALLATHGHLDHVSAAKELGEILGGVPFFLHEADRFLLDSLGETRRQFGLPPADPPHPAGFLAGGGKVPVGGEVLQVLHVPGHSPGSVAFHGDGLLFTGDLLFRGSVGRTDLPGGEGPRLFASIREKVLPLPGSTRILPGHGPETTIDEERRNNPFLLGIIEK